ncbi:Zeta-crystallin [Fusarium sp. LHS14.1]|nr:Zeta-crystallin [Fusarium sp. LHS14.1]
MSQAPGTAIWLGDDGNLSQRRLSETYTPTGSDTLVAVKYSGINAADKKHFLMGLHSFVAGYEFSGLAIVVGDAIFGMNRPQHQRPASLGAHQDYAIAEAQAFFKIPEGMGFEHAAAMVLVSQTVLDGILNCLKFGLPSAGVEGPDPTGQPVLIWGGASGVGVAAIQIAKAVGFGPILTTASPQNHQALCDIGATQCFDYKSPTIVADIRSAVEETGMKLRVMFDAVVGGADPLDPKEQPPFEESTPVLAKSCCSDQDRPDNLKLTAVLPIVKDPSLQTCHVLEAIRCLGFHRWPAGPSSSRSSQEGNGMAPARSRSTLAFSKSDCGSGGDSRH